MPSPTRGRWHGGAVTDEVEAVSSTRRCPPHQSPPATASPHRGSHWSALPKASTPRGGGSAKPRRRGRRKFAATSQALRASIPTPFVPSGHFPLIGGIGPWEGSLFLQLFPLLPAENHPGGRRGGKAGRRVRTSARSTRTFCTPQNKKRETVHIAAGSALVGGYFV